MSIINRQKQSQNVDFPNVRPSLDLRFALTKKLDPRITFTRGSTATYFGADGIMRTADVNEPRFDHNPITGQSLGLLIEESRTNLYTRSDIEGTVGSTPTNMLVSGGSSTGQTLIVSTDVSIGLNGQSAKHTRGVGSDSNVGYMTGATVIAGSTYAFSAYVYIPSSQAKNFDGKYIKFDMESAYTSRTTATVDVTIVDRWQRVKGTCVPSGTSALWVSRTNAVAGSFFYTDCWQLELGSFPTSYMPASGGSQFTRSADLASMTGINFSSWYNQNEGTIFCKYDRIGIQLANTRSSTVLSIDDGTNNTTDYMSFIGGFDNPSSRRFDIQVNDSSTTQTILTLSESVDTQYKAAASYSINNLQTSFNGTLNNPDLNVTYPSVTRMVIGNLTATSTTGNINGHINRLTYYPVKLTDQQLINLTT